MRTRYIQDPKTLKLVPADEYCRESPSGPMIIGDIQPYRSMATGEMIMGRRQHREHLKKHRLVELGNDPIRRQERKPDPTIKRDIINAVQRHWR